MQNYDDYTKWEVINCLNNVNSLAIVFNSKRIKYTST